MEPSNNSGSATKKEEPIQSNFSSYSLKVLPKLDKKLKKLVKKDRKKYDIIWKKAEEIIENPECYKNLNAPLQHLKRVHINSHFVLTFSVDEKERVVILEDFEHHDRVYRK